MKKRFLSNPTYEAALVQSRAFRALNNFMSEILNNYDLNLSEWKLIGHLNEVGQMTPGDISNLLSVKQPITARLLKSLEQKKIIERSANPEDNRQVDVCITNTGKKLVRKMEPEIRQGMRKFLSGVDLSRLEVYGQVLEQIAQKLNSK